MMRRRAFLTGLASIASTRPVAARAQQRNRVPLIGVMISSDRRRVFQQGLRELGYIEGTNLLVEFRAIEDPDELASVAAEFVKLKVDVIVAGGSQAVRAAQQATSTIPIVMSSTSDPVRTGFVATLGRPGGNITGLSLLSPEISGKRLELLKESVPALSRVAVLLNPDDPPALLGLAETEQAARSLGITIQPVEARRPDDFRAAFASAVTHRSEAVVILSAPVMYIQVGRIADETLSHRLPSIHIAREYPAAGGLMSYGPRLDDLVRRAATYVDKILKGVKPADLPVEQPTSFELVINLKTAKALGLTIPQSLLARADEVIE